MEITKVDTKLDEQYIPVKGIDGVREVLFLMASDPVYKLSDEQVDSFVNMTTSLFEARLHNGVPVTSEHFNPTTNPIGGFPIRIITIDLNSEIYGVSLGTHQNFSPEIRVSNMIGIDRCLTGASIYVFTSPVNGNFLFDFEVIRQKLESLFPHLAEVTGLEIANMIFSSKNYEGHVFPIFIEGNIFITLGLNPSQISPKYEDYDFPSTEDSAWRQNGSVITGDLLKEHPLKENFKPPCFEIRIRPIQKRWFNNNVFMGYQTREKIEAFMEGIVLAFKA